MYIGKFRKAQRKVKIKNYFFKKGKNKISIMLYKALSPAFTCRGEHFLVINISTHDFYKS